MKNLDGTDKPDKPEAPDKSSSWVSKMLESFGHSKSKGALDADRVREISKKHRNQILETPESLKTLKGKENSDSDRVSESAKNYQDTTDGKSNKNSEGTSDSDDLEANRQLGASDRINRPTNNEKKQTETSQKNRSNNEGFER